LCAGDREDLHKGIERGEDQDNCYFEEIGLTATQLVPETAETRKVDDPDD